MELDQISAVMVLQTVSMGILAWALREVIALGRLTAALTAQMGGVDRRVQLLEEK